MSAKEKAKELIHEYLNFSHGVLGEYLPVPQEAAKQCARITVQEVLFEVNRLDLKFNLGLEGTRQYWNEVNKEIENL